MLRERKPFDVLDTNSQQGLKRVQPSRAAKTSHKWLSARNEGKGSENNKTLSNLNRLGCDRLIQDKENFGEQVLIKHCHALPKSRSEQPNCKDGYRSHKLPLQTLSVPSMKPNGTSLISRAPNVEDSFLPPEPKSPECSENSTMSISLDTISDTSLLDCEDGNSVQINDSAFFSCTQSSVQLSRSQELSGVQDDSLLMNKSKIVPRRSSVRMDHSVDVVDEYFPEILAYMRDAETRYRPLPGFMHQQPEISSNMRTKLVDWLIEVQDEYKLENETVALAVSYSDRFLSSMSVTRSKLQLLGTTAMFVAAKYEEIYPPDADEFAYVTADTYAKSEVILMERLLLRVLGTAMASPTAHQFLGLLLHNSTASNQFRSLATYLTEMTMLYDRFHHYSYSVLAAAAISVAHHLAFYPFRSNHNDKAHGKRASERFNYLDFDCELSPIVQSYMKDFHDEIYACCLELRLSHRNITSAPQQFIREKYSSKKHHKVALISSSVNEYSQIGSGEDATAAFNRDSFLSIWVKK